MQILRATASKWKSLNTVLKAGQFGYEKDTSQMKIGDGTTVWNSLDYLIKKNNMMATTDPTSSDYIGYSAGSQWFNHSNGLLWVCKSINGTTATWTPMASGYGN